MNSATVVGLDVGARRIGVARGDLEVKLASPLAAIFNDEEVFANLIRMIREVLPAKIVVGLPRNNDGRETEQSEFSRKFANDLRQVLIEREFEETEIVFQDESLTSIAAEENLRARKNFDAKMLRDGTLDSEAATIILQDYLESFAGDDSRRAEK